MSDLPNPPSSFSDAPLDDLLDIMVHDMTDQQLVDFVKHMAVQRSSAQSRKATLKKEDTGAAAAPKRATKKAKDPVAEAERLAKLLGL